MGLLETLDLSNLPAQEDERFEFKCSRVMRNIDAAKEKIAKAASGFWNSGGGIFIAGVDGGGKPDGGIPLSVGRQPIQDWVDQAVQRVSPTGKHSIRLYEHDSGSASNIALNQCVLAVEFAESTQPPHMAPDNRYYVRNGALTQPASHFLVEALWAKRRFTRPILVHTLRFNPNGSDWIQLGIVALTDQPALEVSITLDPVPLLWSRTDTTNPFPLMPPVIDKANPFFMDLVVGGMQDRDLGKNVHLKVEYHDIAGNAFNHTATLDVGKAVGLWKTGTPSETIVKAAESIDKTLKDLVMATRQQGQCRGA